VTETQKAFAAVDALRSRFAPKPKAARKRMEIYVEGVKAKLSQANYASSRVAALYDKTGTTTGGGPLPSVDAQIAFYVDAFFAFLYSSFDVLAQVINQYYGLRMDEHSVSLKSLLPHLKKDPTHKPAHDAIQKVLNSTTFKHLDRYRNCSTHRRQIYLEERTTTRKATSGYNATGPVTTVLRLICDNPYDLNPKVTKTRELQKYCTRMLALAAAQISRITKVV